jgi:hypothetical protein
MNILDVYYGQVPFFIHTGAPLLKVLEVIH